MQPQASDFQDVNAIGLTCDNCGRHRRLDRGKVAELEARGVRSIQQLGGRLYCVACSDEGRRCRSVTVTPYYRTEILQFKRRA